MDLGLGAAALSQGFGDYEKDGFNVFGTLSGQHNDSLRSGQRAFIKNFDIPHTLGWMLSSRTFPANIRIDS
ncbi:MAG: hypothetical protein ACXWP5_12240, partial [Bdellovibrionota bacterium]